MKVSAFPKPYCGCKLSSKRCQNVTVDGNVSISDTPNGFPSDTRIGIFLPPNSTFMIPPSLFILCTLLFARRFEDSSFLVHFSYSTFYKVVWRFFLPCSFFVIVCLSIKPAAENNVFFHDFFQHVPWQQDKNDKEASGKSSITLRGR